MLVLDSSGSMKEPAGGGQTKIGAARSALTRVVRDLPDDAQVGLRVFGAKVFSRTDSGACTDTQQVVAPSTGNRSQLLSAVRAYQPYGETPIPAALQAAAKDLGSSGTRSIVLVSDGESTCSPDPCTVAAQISRQGVDLQINVVGLSVSARARRQLQCIADAGNGTYVDARSADQIRSGLTRAAERALRPFTLTGTPITGGTTAEQASPLTVGEWLDRLPANEDDAGSRFYSVERTAADTTLRVSAVTQGGKGDDSIEVEILSPSGERCDLGQTLRLLDNREVVGALAIASQEDECSEPGTYVIRVARGDTAEGTVPVQLRVTEEPPVTDVGFTASDPDPAMGAVPAASGSASEITGGSSFATAPVLKPGTYRTTIVPGESQVVGVDLDFGQSARVAVRLDLSGSAGRDITATGLPGLITLSDPMFARLTDPAGADFSESIKPGGVTTFSTQTGPISRASLADGAFNGSKDRSIAGTHFVGLSVFRYPDTPSVEIPVTITVAVDGEPQEGPTYADGASWSVADQLAGTAPSSGDASAGPDGASGAPTTGSDAAGDDGGSPARVIGLGAGALGLLGLTAATVLWRRRRPGTPA